MFITNKKAVAMTQEVVAKHAPLILEKLGLLENNDGILDRIEVIANPLTKESAFNARFRHSVTIRGLFGTGGQSYTKGSGIVEINAIALFYFMNKKDEFKDVKIVRLLASNKRFKQQILHSLAHELRHYWQYVTGETWKNGAHLGAVNLMPYEWRWEEKDANEFAASYIKSLKGGE
jgi:hypothetical protein